jgi:transcriptional regulator with XRE-family HTH domain
VEVSLRAVLALTIKRERVLQRKTLRAAAADLNVALGTYQRWENPRSFNATLETMENVANSFGKKLQVSMV